MKTLDDAQQVEFSGEASELLGCCSDLETLVDDLEQVKNRTDKIATRWFDMLDDLHRSTDDPASNIVLLSDKTKALLTKCHTITGKTYNEILEELLENFWRALCGTDNLRGDIATDLSSGSLKNTAYSHGAKAVKHR